MNLYRLALGLAACGGALGQETVFRTEARLLHVYASVWDQRGRPLDGLPRERFEVLENGVPQRLVAFESNSSDLTVGVLLDLTGSMRESMPVLRNAVAKFIEGMSAHHRVGVFAFNEGFETVLPFTQDKAAARRAVMRLRASGRTALFDAISLASAEVEREPGRKLLVVFTDGADNASILNPQAAMRRAQRTGVPVFTVAQGDALRSKALVELLERMAESTGGTVFRVPESDKIREAFEKISSEMDHIYLMAYSPQAAESKGGAWRKIEVRLRGEKAKIRAREGYFPD